jgi:hypothetical protein
LKLSWRIAFREVAVAPREVVKVIPDTEGTISPCVSAGDEQRQGQRQRQRD